AVEQPPQQRLAFLAVGEQEIGEPVLGEQDHLQELLLAELQDLLERVGDVDDTRGAADPHPVDELLEQSGRCLRRHSAAALGRALVGRGTSHAEAPGDRAELHDDLGRIVGVAVVTAQALLTAVVAGYTAVQAEADSVQDAGFARTGAPGDQEDAVVGEDVELDDLAGAERPEPLDLESMQLHQTSASARTRSSSTSRISSASRSLAPWPARTCSRNASMRSASVTAA